VNLRKARRKLGSRKTRKSGTNGKCIGTTTGGRAVKRRFPHPRSRRNAVNVARIMKGLPTIATTVKKVAAKAKS